MIKQVFDVFVSLVALLLLSPLLLVVAILIRIDSCGDIFYCQERVGRSGRPFKIFKFRSMVSDADRIGGYSTPLGDPRVTKIGVFLRKTSLDELPQFLNVVLGDMSLVGPRPNVFAQRKNYSQSDWEKRNSVRPGITGLAQSTARSAASSEERTRLDLEYVDKHSILFDVKILLMTVKQIMGKGSY